MKGSDLRDGIVRVLSRDRQQVLGTGFLVTDTLVVTCSHVLGSLSETERASIALEVLQSHEKVTAKLRPEFSSPEHVADFAVLELNRPLRGAFRTLPLGEAARSADHRFTTFGFPMGSEDTGTWAHGSIGYATGEGTFRKLLLLDSNIREGFSGGPLFDEQTRRVVGVVRFVISGRGEDALREAYASPTELLVEQCPVLRTSEDCPYRDLASFRESDARFWKGRTRVLEEQLLPLVKKLPRFVEVSGPSGCGKSSLLYAGLVPALKEGTFIPGSARWDVRVFRPGLEPFTALDKAGLPMSLEGGQDLVSRLRRWRSEHPEPDQRLVLVIDQLEDLLLRGGGAEEEHRQRFLQQLAGLKDEALPVTCVVALREGFDALLSQRAPALRSLLGEHRVQVPAVLTPAELRDIIAGPAKEVGLRFEPPEMVETISRAAQQEFPVETGVGARATVLPLLEVTMTQLWQASRDGAVTLEAFNASTGLLGMLARWADGVYETLGPSERKLADRLLLELIQFGVADDLLEDKGRRVPIDTLRERMGGHAEVDAVLQVLVNGRLLVTARDGQWQQDTVELIHDALLTHWKHFADLRSRDRAFRRWYTDVQADAERWQEALRVSGVAEADERLLRGTELARARDMLAAHPGEVSWLAERFILRGAEAEQERQQAEQTRTRRVHDLTVKTRALLLALGLAVLTVLVTVAISFGEWWREHPPDVSGDAGSPGDEARKLEELRRARLAAANEVVRLVGGPGQEVEALTKAIALAGARLTTADPAADEARGALAQALSAFLYAVPLSVERDRASSPALVLDGQPEAESVLVAAFSPDGRYAVTRGIPTGSRRLVTRVWDVANGAPLRELGSRELCSGDCNELDLLMTQTQARVTHAFGFSPRDGTLWLGGADGGLVLWTRETFTLLFPRVHTAEVTAVSFSASGDRVLTASLDGTAQLWDTETSQPVGPRMKHLEPCEQAVLSPDGRYALVAGQERTCLFDTATGTCKPFEVGGSGPTLGFSSSSELAVLGDSRVSDRLLVWNVRSGKQHRLLQGDLGGHIFTPFFTEDGCGVVGFDRNATSAQEHRLCKETAARRGQRAETPARTGSWRGFTAETRFLLDGRREQKLVPALQEAQTADSPFLAARGRLPPPLLLSGLPPDRGNAALVSPTKEHLLAVGDTGFERRALDIDLSSYREGGMSIPSPDLRWLVTRGPPSVDGTRNLLLFDTKTSSARPLGSCTRVSDGEWTAAFSQGGRLAVACGGRLWLWDLANAPDSRFAPDAPAMLTSEAGKARPWTKLEFSPDGLQLLAMSPGQGATLWSSRDGRMVRELGPLVDAAFSEDGEWLLLVGPGKAGASRVVSAQRAATGEVLCESQGLTGVPERLEVSWKAERFVLQQGGGSSLLGSTRDCAFLKPLPPLSDGDLVRFSPDGTRFVTRYEGGSGSALWDSATGEKLQFLPGPIRPGPPPDAVFSPDSRLLVFLPEPGGELMALDAATGERTLMVPLGIEVGAGVRTFTFTPDGSRLIVVVNKSIRLVDTQNWKQLAAIDLPEGSDFRLWHAGSFFGLTGQNLSRVQLWSARDGRRLATLHGALTWGELRANPAGDYILTSDGTEARLFSLRREDLLERACALMMYRSEYSRLRESCDSSTDRELKPAAVQAP
ncbi:trypsin-like peptidase domain-containing protein [Myxococcus sp. RHSTA-1-4]|uniref:nSTAND1 domain-containing NTPase n=1 Tax=Myxococcus sp. RHSTA-1-4 TaxID=2874601 RepID=UPI001CBB1FD4|nr:trypsin-like peptidase domain-containing protein [Myxococcus sp. RHSTA-1-4]MBZ4416184.1 trypsin-like peptidase domain-containing protein [Myxococcus sp. RHSTA-1-4]